MTLFDAERSVQQQYSLFRPCREVAVVRPDQTVHLQKIEIGRDYGQSAFGHGFVVAVPEIFHELEAPGTELAYDASGTERGNQDKVGKPVSDYDSDARAVIDFLRTHPASTGKLGSS